MRNIKLIFLLAVMFGCRPMVDSNQVITDMLNKLDAGNLREVIRMSDSLKTCSKDDSQLVRIADSLAQIAERISYDFSLSEDEVISALEKRMDTFSVEDKASWEDKGWLELRIINNEKMYFRRTVSNLLILKKFYEHKDAYYKEIADDPEMISRLEHTEKVYNASVNQHNPVTPVNLKVTYTITVNPDVVPDGEKIRCWLPWPRNNHLRQKNIVLLSASEPEYIIAPDSAIHSSIYMEKPSSKGEPTVFRVSFSYQSSAQYFSMRALKILPYDKESDNYKKYTSEQLPNINFSEKIRLLADSITGPDDYPAEIVSKIYSWFKENIPWTGALEYSVMKDIPGYVCQNMRGDCGMQTFLFISMLRYKGIPVRWQSGWMVPPDYKNLHDWCEIYYEGTGWIPADISYDLQPSEIRGIKEFYLSGIDAYRLIVNDGVAGPLHPGKHYFRSEPYDFQRGEVEWKGGNLYFDKWDYNMKIDYLK